MHSVNKGERCNSLFCNFIYYYVLFDTVLYYTVQTENCVSIFESRTTPGYFIFISVY